MACLILLPAVLDPTFRVLPIFFGLGSKSGPTWQLEAGSLQLLFLPGYYRERGRGEAVLPSLDRKAEASPLLEQKDLPKLSRHLGVEAGRPIPFSSLSGKKRCLPVAPGPHCHNPSCTERVSVDPSSFSLERPFLSVVTAVAAGWGLGDRGHPSSCRFGANAAGLGEASRVLGGHLEGGTDSAMPVPLPLTSLSSVP